MKTIDEINLELQEASDAEYEAKLQEEYEMFVDWLHYCWTCEQLDIDWTYNEFG